MYSNEVRRRLYRQTGQALSGIILYFILPLWVRVRLGSGVQNVEKFGVIYENVEEGYGLADLHADRNS